MASRRRFLRTAACLGAATGFGPSAFLDTNATTHNPRLFSAEPNVSTAARPSIVELLKRRPLLIAHRGLPGVAPENSLPSFEAALRHAPDVVELDYHQSADDVPIVLHDETLDRTTDAVRVFGGEKIAVAEKSAAALAQLDSGSWFDPKFAGLKLPTLAEAIDLVCPRACLMIERKGGCAPVLVELLRCKRVAERVIVQAFEWDFIADCRRRDPGLVTGLLGEGAITDEKLAEARRIGSPVLGWKAKDLDAAALARAHDAGLLVWAWTVNDEDLARRLVSQSLDGLITNRADVARAWLTAR